ncbi:MAG: hypothetical protein R3C01_05975 [Planctomycetaceae bacterium]
MTQSDSEIDDLAYGPASNVITDDDGPLRGDTVFCGVPYTFEREPDEDADANTWGVWFVLTPVDANLGLPIRAMGRFRGATSVRWTSFGSPTLINGPNIREQYAGFLERLANETATYALWDAFNVAHYSDDCLEQVRIECVRLLYDRDSLSPLTNDERATLLSLIARLRE